MQLRFIFIKSSEKRADFCYKKLGLRMGKNCEILCNFTAFGSEPYLIRLGDRVKVTSGVKFITHDGGLHVLRNMGLLPNSDKFGTIEVGSNVFIGINSIILPNVKIGNNCIIGAGSVVTKDIPANSVVIGVPATVVKNISDYHEQIKDNVDFTHGSNAEEKRAYLSKKFRFDY